MAALETAAAAVAPTLALEKALVRMPISTTIRTICTQDNS
jgi:hypothetical protein